MLNHTISTTSVVAGTMWVLAIGATVAGTVCLIVDHPFVALGLYSHAILALGGACTSTIRACMQHSVHEIINAVEINRDLMPGANRFPGVQHIPIKRG